MKMPGSPRGGGFTLIELLVVVVIVILVSAVTLPTVLPALSHREVSESARILQAALVGARDAAIRANGPRGVRLLPDPVLTVPSLSDPIKGSQAGSLMLAYNRFVPIEPAGDYKEGRVTISSTSLGEFIPGVLHPIPASGDPRTPNFPPLYPWNNPSDPTITYPCYPGVPNPALGRVLMIEESVFINDTPPSPNPPTSWYWNIRVGDKLRIGDSGRHYTVVGPMSIRNPEMFVNIGAPGTPSPLVRRYPGLPNPTPIEFLFLVNGQDDNNNGLVDEGFNGINDNMGSEALMGIPPPGLIDEFLPNKPISEWEIESWVGTQKEAPAIDQPYVITRRPVPTQGAREVSLPPGVVIDSTSWNATRERSRLPIDPNSLYVDIMLNPAGEVIPTTVYSTPATPGLSGLDTAFYHFWLTERQDVHELTELWRDTTNKDGKPYLLPMPLGSPNYTPSLNPTLALKGDRRMITLFARTGLITSDTIESFDGNDINRPYYDARLGSREAK